MNDFTALSFAFQTDSDYDDFHAVMLAHTLLALKQLRPAQDWVRSGNDWHGFDLVIGERTARLAFDDNQVKVLAFTGTRAQLLVGEVFFAGGLCHPTLIAAALDVALGG